MAQAKQAFNSTDKKHYGAMDGHQEHLKTYINKTVRDGTKPSVEGYTEHLVHSLSAKPKFEHSIPEPGSTKITGGKPAKPEGFVVIRNNRPTKFVDRAEFSRANFASRPR